MKKILAILALAVISATAMAGDSATVEYQNLNNIGSADQKNIGLSVKHEFSQSVAGDIGISNTVTEGTSALSTRTELGATYSAPIGFNLKGYVRGAMGQKFTNTGDYTYYAVEPGVSTSFGAVTVKAGYRYRSAIDPTTNNDQTHTARIGVAYALTKNDTVGLRFDRVRGDSVQNVTAVNYTRGF
jgi:opacity protein-like surface antigen